MTNSKFLTRNLINISLKQNNRMTFPTNNKQLKGDGHLEGLPVTDLLYRPSELRSSRISAWCSSSRLSMDLGWMVGDMRSCLQVSCSMAGPGLMMSPPGSREE